MKVEFEKEAYFLKLVKDGHFHIDKESGIIRNARGMVVGSRHKSGFIYVSARMPDGKVKAIPAQRLIWLSVHGAIPPNHIIGFKDNDNSNLKLDNLVLAKNSSCLRKLRKPKISPKINKITHKMVLDHGLHLRIYHLAERVGVMQAAMATGFHYNIILHVKNNIAKKGVADNAA